MKYSNHRFRLRPIMGLALLGLLAAVADMDRATLAQGTTVPGAGPGQSQPTPGDPKRTIPEQIEPAPGATPPRDAKERERTPGIPQANPPRPGETLSDKLDRTDGVITPPKGVDPEMKVPAPVPNPNTTPVIPPPGSPGNPSPVEPK